MEVRHPAGGGRTGQRRNRTSQVHPVVQSLPDLHAKMPGIPRDRRMKYGAEDMMKKKTVMKIK